MDKLKGKILGNPKKGKKRSDDEAGGATVAGEKGPSKTKTPKNSNKEKKGGSVEQKPRKSADAKAAEAAAAPAADAAPAAAPSAEGGGRPLVRKKDSKMQPSRMQGQPGKEKETKEAAADNEPKELKDKDGIFDPERDQRALGGFDPENMTDQQFKNLRAYVAQYEAMGVKGLLDEFESIKTYNITPFNYKAHDENPTKNRYKDIFCIDVTRIPLKDGKEATEGDYVHANLVEGAPFHNRFVTTQGPIPTTVNDFWRLVVQENVGYIFMLCSIVELGKKKCEVYIPEKPGETVTYGGEWAEWACLGVDGVFADVIVTLLSAVEDGHFINSKLTMEAPGKPKRYIYHHYWKNWPDRGVPQTALAGLRLLRHARQSNYSSIVHCSAGVGRTGTLVAIEWLLQTICRSPPPYDMKEMLKYMRNHRAHAIQTAPQYVYIAFAIFRMLAVKDLATIPQFMKFSQDIQVHTGVKIDGGAAPPAAPAAAAAAPAPANP